VSGMILHNIIPGAILVLISIFVPGDGDDEEGEDKMGSVKYRKIDNAWMQIKQPTTPCIHPCNEKSNNKNSADVENEIS